MSAPSYYIKLHLTKGDAEESIQVIQRSFNSIQEANAVMIEEVEAHIGGTYNLEQSGLTEDGIWEFEFGNSVEGHKVWVEAEVVADGG
tara:strand:- start:13324 stop:13587 length:264 start_codon:yes stop_codon:yes gene_type:complete